MIVISFFQQLILKSLFSLIVRKFNYSPSDYVNHSKNEILVLTNYFEFTCSFHCIAGYLEYRFTSFNVFYRKS